MAKLSDSNKEFIRSLVYEGGYSDDDLVDIFEENNISCHEAFRFIADISVPECCRGCKYACFYRSMFPCTTCKRSRQLDYYEQDEEDI